MLLKNILKLISPKYQKLFLDYKIVLKPRYGHRSHAHTQLYEIINENRESYIEILNWALELKAIFQYIKRIHEETDFNQPVYNNGYLPALDMIGIYTIITKYRPAKYIEIGSGNSTKVAYKAISDNNLKTSIVAVDPEPRSGINQLVSELIRKPIENIDFDFLFDLKENDILFVDNSHRILPNSDSMVFFLEILPKIPKGVLVHLHDIYLPYDYPQFMCDRFYSEQYGLAINLLADSKKYHPVLPNYFISEDPELKSILDPIWDHPNMEGLEKHGCSFWLRVC